VRAQGIARAEAACSGRTWGRARVLLEVGEGPDGRGPPGGEGEREIGASGWARREGAMRLGRLGCAGVEKKEKAGWAGPCGRKGRDGEKEREMG
jgi:hypothetical protein